MDLDYLDQMIPKRWILLLRYWLPFLKTPSIFYFECRSFINELMRLDHYIFWDKFPELVTIFERTVSNETERNLSLEILSKIFVKEKKITPKYLKLLFAKFNPDIKRKTSILNDVLQHIPNTTYTQYFSQLKSVNCSLHDLKWCAYLKTKFKLEDRLTLVLSLPDDKLIDYQPTISQLLMQELEDVILNVQETDKFFNAYVNEQLIQFIFNRELIVSHEFKFTRKHLIFSDTFLQLFINQLLEKQDPLLVSYFLNLDIPAKFNFFETFLIHSQNFHPISQYFFNLCQTDQWSEMVDHLITSVYSVQGEEKHENEPKIKKMTADNWNLFLLTLLIKSDYSLNLFQFLAIHRLTKKPLDLEQLKKFCNADYILQQHKHFSLACQLSVTEYSIQAIKEFIKDHYMIHVHKENTRQDIHRAFYQFYNNEYNGKPLNVAKLILKKLPKDLQDSCEEDLNFLQTLLSKLHSILDNPKLTDYKNKCLIIKNKKQSEEEDLNNARIELTHRILQGEQTLVSYQRMQELFANQAPIIQEKWTQLAIGIHFFDANDPEEYKAAKKRARETQEAIKFNREYNDFSCLSSSPSSASYFYG